MRASIVVRRLTTADVPFGLALSTAANWNQLEADWRRVVTLEPYGCFVASLDGRDVGTVSAVVFDSVAWIGLMLVDPSVRRRGVGRALMEHALAWLEQRQVATVRLDATPLGQPLYEQLGFTVDYLLDRFAGAPRFAPQFTPRPPRFHFTSATTAELERFDRAINGASRGGFLAALASEWPDETRFARDDRDE
ncbi:MAG TPA: GNAT family N-acetyltransferase, partial [Pirellulaceae bacterium]|nr:GNAT family N-acetyltransferase [Pirellulaceae bacterium]